jgi:hypothetical protein
MISAILQRRRWAVAGAAASLAAVVGAGLALASNDGVPDPVTRLAVLRAAPRPADVLPASLARGFANEIVLPAGGRLLGSFDGSDWYLAPGRDHYVCILQADNVNQTTGGVCSPADALDRGMTLVGASPKGGLDVAMLMPDGYTSVSAASALASASGPNVQFLRLDRSTEVRMTGSDVPPVITTVGSG